MGLLSVPLYRFQADRRGRELENLWYFLGQHGRALSGQPDGDGNKKGRELVPHGPEANMVPGLPRPPNDNDSRPAILSLEALMAAPTVDTPDTLLSERGEMGRQLGRRLSMPLAELIDHLREGGA